MNLERLSRVMLALLLAAGVVWVTAWGDAPLSALDKTAAASGPSAFEDSDGDLLPDALEHVLMMDPTRADSDGDGTDDFLEAVQHQVVGNPPPSPPLPLDHEMRVLASTVRLPGLGQQIVLNVLLRVADGDPGQVTSLMPFIGLGQTKIPITTLFVTGIAHVASRVDPVEGLYLLVSSRLASPAQLQGLMPLSIGASGTIGQRSFETGSVLVHLDETVLAILPVPNQRFVLHPIDSRFRSPLPQNPANLGTGFWQSSKACELDLAITGAGGGFAIGLVVQAACTGAPTLSCPPSCSSLRNRVILIPDGLGFLTGN